MQREYVFPIVCVLMNMLSGTILFSVWCKLNFCQGGLAVVCNKEWGGRRGGQLLPYLLELYTPFLYL